MVGRFGSVIIGGLACAAGVMAAQPEEKQASPAASAAPSATPEASSSPHRSGPIDHPENFQQFINQLPPAQKERFQQNLDLWNTLTPEERKNLRARYEERRKRIKGEIDGAIRDAGLNLDEPTQKSFADRYFDERRKIEQTLRRDMDGKRRELTKGLLSKLQMEFASKSRPVIPTAAPAAPTSSAAASAPPTAASSPSPSAR